MSDEQARHRNIEFWGAVLLVALMAIALLPVVVVAQQRAGKSSCQTNLKQLGIVFKMYAGENKDRWPALSPYPDNWIPDTRQIYPEYLTDLNVLMCPGSPFAAHDAFESRLGPTLQPHPECVSSAFYTYAGFAIWCDEMALAVFDASRNWDSLVVAKQLVVDSPVWPDSDRLSFVNQWATPVLWDRVPLDVSEMSHGIGVNVLHMDGHVAFVRYSDRNNSNFFPATRIAAETFGSVAPQMPYHCIVH